MPKEPKPVKAWAVMNKNKYQTISLQEDQAYFWAGFGKVVEGMFVPDRVVKLKKKKASEVWG